MNSPVMKKHKITKQKSKNPAVSNKIAEIIGLNNYKVILDALCTINDTQLKSKAMCAFFANSSTDLGEKSIETDDTGNCSTTINQPYKNEISSIQVIPTPVAEPTEELDRIGKPFPMFADPTVMDFDDSSDQQITEVTNIEHAKDLILQKNLLTEETVPKTFSELDEAPSSSAIDIISTHVVSQSCDKLVSMPKVTCLKNSCGINFRKQPSISKPLLEKSEYSKAVLLNIPQKHKKIGSAYEKILESKEISESKFRSNRENFKSDMNNIDALISSLSLEKYKLFERLKKIKLSLLPCELPLKTNDEPLGWFVDQKFDKVPRLEIKLMNIISSAKATNCSIKNEHNLKNEPIVVIKPLIFHTKLGTFDM